MLFSTTLTVATMASSGTSAGRAVAGDREQRQEQQRPADPDLLEHASHHDDLDDRRQRADPGLEVSVEGPDEVAPARDRDQLGLGVHHLGEDEVPGRVDEVEEQDRQPDQQEVAIAEDQRESAAFVARLAGPVGHALPVTEAGAVALVRRAACSPRAERPPAASADRDGATRWRGRRSARPGCRRWFRPPR